LGYAARFIRLSPRRYKGKSDAELIDATQEGGDGALLPPGERGGLDVFEPGMEIETVSQGERE
jgi:hypothetical protein